MDRNLWRPAGHPEPAGVALRKESVDRNNGDCEHRRSAGQSLSARRAWIEIAHDRQQAHYLIVALRKESVDRNYAIHCRQAGAAVALRKESVDRNYR